MNLATLPHWNRATVKQKVGLLNYEVSFGKKNYHLSVQLCQTVQFFIAEISEIKACF